MRASALLSIVALLAACGSGSKRDRAAESLRTVASWAATVRLTARSWRDGAVPAPFAGKTCEVAAQELASTLDQLASEPPSELRGALAGRLESPDSAAARVRAAIARGDRAAVAREEERLAGAERRARTLADALKPER